MILYVPEWSIILVSLFTERKRTQQSDEQKLLTFILRNYDKTARPVYNSSQTVQVNISFEAIKIEDLVCKSIK